MTDAMLPLAGYRARHVRLEVAAAALFLCLPAAAAVNGAAVPVAGGEI